MLPVTFPFFFFLFHPDGPHRTPRCQEKCTRHEKQSQHARHIHAVVHVPERTKYPRHLAQTIQPVPAFAHCAFPFLFSSMNKLPVFGFFSSGQNSRPCANSFSIRLAAISQYSSLNSMPTALRPCLYAAMSVVPLPINGSNISPAILPLFSSHSINPSGFGHGWP